MRSSLFGFYLAAMGVDVVHRLGSNTSTASSPLGLCNW